MSQLMPYVEAGGDPLLGRMSLQPPFEFDNVEVMVLPLRADISKLNIFCNNYLTIHRDQNLIFKPAAPYVFLMILNYGKMGSEVYRRARNLGWVSQHEVTFTVPLECWEVSRNGTSKKGELVFRDWAGVSPFIYVDDQVSLRTGREVYGWPKVFSKVNLNSAAIRFPNQATQVLKLDTYLSPRSFGFSRNSLDTLLEVESKPEALSSLFPPSLSEKLLPWKALSNWTDSTLKVLGEAVDDSLGLSLRGYSNESNTFQGLMGRGKRALNYLLQASSGSLNSLWWHPLLSGLRENFRGGVSVESQVALLLKNITLKQFLDSERPNLACYQAIVQSEMGVQRVRGSGLMGELNMLLGDISGGYSIRIHSSPVHPIISSLGIEVEHTERNSDGGEVSLLKPIFPYWSNFDLNYGMGKVLYENHLPTKGSQEEKSPDFTFNHNFNTVVGTASRPISGPIHYPDTQLNIYPLKATKIEKFVEDYFQALQSPAGSDGKSIPSSNLSFKAEGEFAYLVTRNIYDEQASIWSESDQLDWWSEQTLQICVPVQMTSGTHPDRNRLSLVTAYSFSSCDRAALADREMNGKPTDWAVFDMISNSEDMDTEESLSHYLEMKTEVFHSFNDGEPGNLQTLIEIIPAVDSQDAKDQDRNELDAILNLFSSDHGSNPEKKSADLSDNDAEQPNPLGTVTFLTIKQYRDAENPKEACYQSLIQQNVTANPYQSNENIVSKSTAHTQAVRIRIQQFPSHPIVEALGLEYETVESKQEKPIIYNLQSKALFSCRVSMKESLGKMIALVQEVDKVATWREV